MEVIISYIWNEELLKWDRIQSITDDLKIITGYSGKPLTLRQYINQMKFMSAYIFKLKVDEKYKHIGRSDHGNYLKLHTYDELVQYIEKKILEDIDYFTSEN